MKVNDGQLTQASVSILVHGVVVETAHALSATMSKNLAAERARDVLQNEDHGFSLRKLCTCSRSTHTFSQSIKP